jgi:dienelactone hydrolase
MSYLLRTLLAMPAEILLFHHALGLTPGIRDFAGTLRRAGHTVHVPDLYEGRTFDTLEQGIGYAKEVGFGTIIERGRGAAEALPSGLVYIGVSLGVLPAQMLAQTRAGAAGALLLESFVPTSEFGGGWPQGVPVQVHGMDADEIFAGEGDLDAARALVESTPGAQLFLYPGKRHLFADNSLPSYDEQAAALLTERVLAFLGDLRRA